MTLTVENLEMSDEAVSAEIRAGELSQPLSFRVEGASFGRELDFLVPLTLLPAMKKGVPIALPGDLSPRLLTSSADIQAIFRLWNPSYEAVALDARRRAPDGAQASGVGCFFSAGVDSFYTAVKHQDEITHLIYLRTGFDRTEPAADENLRAAAEELGKPLIELETNVRPIANAFAVEFADYSSAPLAAAALLFQSTFEKVFIASSFSYLALTRWGSHPLIDPLWSTESLEFVHDGCEATRPMKLAMLADNDVAMRRLRVCHRTGVDGAGGATVNCGECPKCIRTMINLRAAGAAGRCATLPDTLDLRDVESLRSRTIAISRSCSRTCTRSRSSEATRSWPPLCGRYWSGRAPGRRLTWRCPIRCCYGGGSTMPNGRSGSESASSSDSEALSAGG